MKLVSILRGSPTRSYGFVLTIPSLVLVYPLMIFLFQSLQLTDSHLIIRAGPFRRRIALYDVYGMRSVG